MGVLSNKKSVAKFPGRDRRGRVRPSDVQSTRPCMHIPSTMEFDLMEYGIRPPAGLDLYVWGMETPRILFGDSEDFWICLL